LVSVTKYRHDVFAGEHLHGLKEIMRRVCTDFDCELVKYNRETNHAHLLAFRHGGIPGGTIFECVVSHRADHLRPPG
jgi:hypothetical protein